MKLYDIEFVKLLPTFMRDDLTVKGLSLGTEEVIKAFAAAEKTMTVWNHIDSMTEAELDELAWELNILWYNKAASLEVKREIVLNSDKVYQKLGTKWAVENVITTYFGEGHIFEWFEYDGQPGHFKILSANPTIANEKLSEFLNILQKVKRASAILDGILITLTGQMWLHTGIGYHEASIQQIWLGGAWKKGLNGKARLFAGLGYYEFSAEQVPLGEVRWKGGDLF